MDQPHWRDILIPPSPDEALWEVFHENSKIDRHSYALSKEKVRSEVQQLYESLPFEGYPIVDLSPSLVKLPDRLDEALLHRESVRDLTPSAITLEQLTAVLHYSYGITRRNKDTDLPRPFRIVPSGGALYPLELFVYSAHLQSLQAGLYHYNPSKHNLRLLRVLGDWQPISKLLIQSELACKASLFVFITAIFSRSAFKYGDRSYRFIHLEAGHVAQNVNLVSNALGFGCLNIGGFFDREVDAFLGLDGLTHSTIYMIAIGKAQET